jgi:hypothetical protein
MIHILNRIRTLGNKYQKNASAQVLAFFNDGCDSSQIIESLSEPLNIECSPKWCPGCVLDAKDDRSTAGRVGHAADFTSKVLSCGWIRWCRWQQVSRTITTTCFLLDVEALNFDWGRSDSSCQAIQDIFCHRSEISSSSYWVWNHLGHATFTSVP